MASPVRSSLQTVFRPTPRWQIASTHGARVIQREWVNHATQFNWALTQLDTGADWVLRIDADEVLTPELAAEIKARLPGIGPEVDGVYCSRRMTFQGRLMRHGGIFPVRVLRLFRHGPRPVRKPLDGRAHQGGRPHGGFQRRTD
jgi:glycosyltransferase involved in cell wall biosynthesis